MAKLQSNTRIYGTANIDSVLVVGNITSNNSTSNVTGSLRVTGGVGITGNLYTGRIVIAGANNGVTFGDGTTQFTAAAAGIGVGIIAYANTVSSNNLIDTFSQSLYRSANYDIVVQNGSGYEFTKLMVLQTDTNASILEYGILSSSTYSLGNFTANVSGGFVNVYFSPLYTGNTTVNITRTTLSNTGIASVLVLNQTYDFNVVTLPTIDTQTLVNAPIDLNFT